MKKDSKLTLLLALVVGLLILIFFWKIIWPRYTDLNDRANEARQAKVAAEAQLAKAKELKKNEKEIRQRLVNLQARVPHNMALPNLIVRLDELALANNLIWISGTPEDINTTANNADQAATTQDGSQTTTQAPQLTKHDLSIVVRGSMPDFLKFMHGMTDKSIGRMIEISALDVQFEAENGPDAIEATLKLKVIGWKDGERIDSNGCITVDGVLRDPIDGDADCNRTNVKGSS